MKDMISKYSSDYISNNTYSLDYLFHFSKKHSPFYQRLYKNISSITKISDLPPIDSSDFWAQNTIENNQILTYRQQDGIIFKSGGTTGNPKFSFFSKDEWELFTFYFGQGLKQGGMGNSDKVANLFYAGDLYASFMFIAKSIENSLTEAIHFPLTGAVDYEIMSATIHDFKINAVAGTPTTLIKLVEYMLSKNTYLPSKLLFGGESLYPDQRDYLLSMIPDVEIKSIGYASVDGGLLGYIDSTCDHQEHRAFDEATIMEILDEDTLQPISETNIPGKLYLTNLTRKLMPIIRYPVGDKAMWIEPSSEKNRKFKILGRSEEGARIGPATVYYDDIMELLSHFHEDFTVKGLQLITTHFENKDKLSLNLAIELAADIEDVSESLSISEQRKIELINKIENKLLKERKFLGDLINKNLIHPIEVLLIPASELVINSRTGKTKRVLDLRSK